mmetsp:Transcript_10452/g.19075  ORF Transcript_10452/g.19075 Transcript_10452/m.19075 type:complete len:883 (-) Transcript_10452:235-2883(-)|eukprot:CAMPEP_0197519112 /NCGR_PEP_ID=MMETSP1318-20131121/4370_1 /TAXON_ID=552666 /ORGANISM="Partenskyella glossopodia, Strain RCC365" /LENGTH=882 /DNA_ID=CAMNT_0043069907 /DNA_START=59 /DNA_END=2707 /DNA_ORIENTATION=-
MHPSYPGQQPNWQQQQQQQQQQPYAGQYQQSGYGAQQPQAQQQQQPYAQPAPQPQGYGQQQQYAQQPPPQQQQQGYGANTYSQQPTQQQQYRYPGYDSKGAAAPATSSYQQPNAYQAQAAQQPSYQQQQQHHQPHTQQPQYAQPPVAQMGNMSISNQHTQQQPSMMKQQPQLKQVVPDYVYTCDPKQLSLTTNVFPTTTTTAQRSKVPLGIVLQPLAESEVECPLINFGSVGVVRCKHCRAYINPYVIWTDGGAHWKCNLCWYNNECPSGYFSPVDTNGMRADIAKRPELIHSTVEIVATPHYMIRAPMPCVFFFVLDVSKASTESGMLARACQAIADSLDDLPGGKRTMVGFITYDSKVHLYSFGAQSARMHVLADLDDIFLPQPRGLLVNLAEHRQAVNSLLEALPQMHAATQQIETAFGPALEATLEVMKAVGGKVSVFASNLPSIGKGRLINRDNPQKLGKADEHKLLLAGSQYYKDLAFKMSHVQISCDLYLFSRYYFDVATLNDLPKYTGGQTHSFPAYYDEKDGHDLYRLVVHSLTRAQGWESVIRVRVGKGAKLLDFFGNFRLRSTDLLTVPCVDSDKAFGLSLGVSGENGVTSQSLSVQAALLYTTSFGERRIRVQTICVPASSFPNQVYENVVPSTLTNYLFKQAMAMVTSFSFDKARSHVRNSITSLLRAYSYAANKYSHSQQLNLPENLAPLPIQCIGILKHLAFRDQTVPSDTRAATHALLYPMGIDKVDLAVRPRLVPIHNLDGKSMPEELELSASSIESDAAYLLDDGCSFIIRIGSRVNQQTLSCFVQATESKHLSLAELGEDGSGSEYLQRIHQLLDALRTPFHKRVVVVKEGDTEELHFFSNLILDRCNGEMSLPEYMQFVLRR